MIWNGLLVTTTTPAWPHPNADYQGVAHGTQWPLEYLYSLPTNATDHALTISVNKYFDGYSFHDGSAPPSLVPDVALVKRYVARCAENDVETRVLLCATCQQLPIMESHDVNRLIPLTQPLGYDYAYSSCSFSPLAINEQELIDPALGLPAQQRNAFGLFDTVEEIDNYIEGRNKFIELAGVCDVLVDGLSVRTSPLEDSGDFLIFRVYKIESDLL